MKEDAKLAIERGMPFNLFKREELQKFTYYDFDDKQVAKITEAYTLAHDAAQRVQDAKDAIAKHESEKQFEEEEKKKNGSTPDSSKLSWAEAMKELAKHLEEN